MTELLPCPFCGGKARFDANADDSGEYIQCTECFASTRAIYPEKGEVAKEKAKEAWNKRTILIGENNGI